LGVFGLVVVVAGFVAVLLRPDAGRSAARPPAPPPPPAVTISLPLRAPVVDWQEFTGQFSAVDTVDIRARVSGYLTEIHFTDGQIVHKGDLLFVIDPRPFEIELQQAAAQYQSAMAQLDLASRELTRTDELRKNDFASRETYDQRKQQMESAQAAVDQAKAAIRSAQLDLEFSHIRAPITGRIGAHQVSVGNLISGSTGTASGVLATIVSLDPIYLDFDMSEADYLAFMRSAGRPGTTGDVAVEARLADESRWKRRGTLDFLDNRLDRGSGTIRARATFENADGLLTPGSFARLRLAASPPHPGLLVPDAAITTDQSRQLVMTVAPDGTVVPKLVQTGALHGTLREIASGLTADDKVIVNGLMRARPGAKVTPEPGHIEANAES
jgi:RND family efflux transporter MFP subunit